MATTVLNMHTRRLNDVSQACKDHRPKTFSYSHLGASRSVHNALSHHNRSLRIPSQGGAKKLRLHIMDSFARVDNGIPAIVYVAPILGAAAASCVLFATVVPPAHVGIEVSLGVVQETTLSSGLQFRAPWQQIIPLDTKTQLLSSQNVVPTNEGLNVELEVDFLYRLNAEKARDMYLQVGTQYEQTIIEPQLRSAIRNLTSENSAQALYTEGRLLLRDQLQEELTEKLESRGIIVEDVLIKSIQLPSNLTNAIQTKLKKEQESQQMQFVLAKERAEAERKKIEAQGIAEFQRIVSENVTPEMLKWKGIEATEKLAESSNAKIVIAGNSESSLPVILNGGS